MKSLEDVATDRNFDLTFELNEHDYSGSNVVVAKLQWREFHLQLGWEHEVWAFNSLLFVYSGHCCKAAL